MANRHQRRKRARAKAIMYANRSNEAKFSDYVAETVRRNLQGPKPERSFAPSSVALVASGQSGHTVRHKRTPPYTKHSAGATPMPANYPIDNNTLSLGERQLRSLKAKDRALEAPATRYPVVKR